MSKIKVGTIGYGGAFNMGREHLEQMRDAGFEPTAVCDIDPDRVKIANDNFPGIETYTSVATMLRKSEVEMLAIILPHNVHAKVSLQCLKAGRHVVVEKPFAVTVDECDALIKEANKRKLVCSTFHNRHWDPIILTLRKHIKKIGRPFRWESFSGNYCQPGTWWRSDKKISGGIIYDWGAHFMEWALQVMPYEMKEVSGYMVDEVWKTTNEDELEAVVRFKNNAVASHTASNLCAAVKQEIRLTGTKGAFTATQSSLTLHKPDKNTGEVETVDIPLEKGLQHLYYKNVHDHMAKGKELIITPEWARRVIQVLDYASQSAKKNKALPVKYK